MRDFPERAGAREIDAPLALLVGYIHRGMLRGFSLTAVLPGATIVGSVVGQKEWYDLWLEQMAQSGAGGGNLAAHLSKMVDETGLYILDNDLPEKDLPTYLHFKEATIYFAGGQQGPTLVRAALRSVSAWTLGVAPQDEG